MFDVASSDTQCRRLRLFRNIECTHWKKRRRVRLCFIALFHAAEFVGALSLSLPLLLLLPVLGRASWCSLLLPGSLAVVVGVGFCVLACTPAECVVSMFYFGSCGTYIQARFLHDVCFFRAVTACCFREWF